MNGRRINIKPIITITLLAALYGSIIFSVMKSSKEDERETALNGVRIVFTDSDATDKKSEKSRGKPIKGGQRTSYPQTGA